MTRCAKRGGGPGPGTPRNHQIWRSEREKGLWLVWFTLKLGQRKEKLMFTLEIDECSVFPSTPQGQNPQVEELWKIHLVIEQEKCETEVVSLEYRLRWGGVSIKDSLKGSSVDGSAAHLLHLREVIFIIMCIRTKSVPVWQLPRNQRISTAEVVY